MNRKHNGGYSLVEVLIAMAVLGIMTIPTTSALLTAHRMNVKADSMLQDQLEVSSAIEIMMAEGIKGTKIDPTSKGYELPENVDAAAVVKAVPGSNGLYYEVIVTSGDVQIKTHIHAAD